MMVSKQRGKGLLAFATEERHDRVDSEDTESEGSRDCLRGYSSDVIEYLMQSSYINNALYLKSLVQLL